MSSLRLFGRLGFQWLFVFVPDWNLFCQQFMCRLPTKLQVVRRWRMCRMPQWILATKLTVFSMYRQLQRMHIPDRLQSLQRQVLLRVNNANLHLSRIQPHIHHHQRTRSPMPPRLRRMHIKRILHLMCSWLLIFIPDQLVRPLLRKVQDLLLQHP